MADNLGESVRSIADSMAEIARSGRIGKPVFARWTETVETSGTSGDAMRAAADRAVDAISRWMGSPPERRRSLGSPAAGNLSVLCAWDGGESAVIATGAASADDRPGVDIALIGNSGAAYYRGASEGSTR